jgi:hypothetical protein
MKRPTAVWIISGTAALVFAAYVFDRGVYIGPYVKVTATQVGPWYDFHCRYLHWYGVYDLLSASATMPNYPEATEACPFLEPPDKTLRSSRPVPPEDATTIRD